MNNKTTALLFVMILCAGAAFAADASKPVEPKKGRILVVGQLKYKNPIDLDARKDGFAEKKTTFGLGNISDCWSSQIFLKNF